MKPRKKAENPKIQLHYQSKKHIMMNPKRCWTRPKWLESIAESKGETLEVLESLRANLENPEDVFLSKFVEGNGGESKVSKRKRYVWNALRPSTVREQVRKSKASIRIIPVATYWSNKKGKFGHSRVVIFRKSTEALEAFYYEPDYSKRLKYYSDLPPVVRKVVMKTKVFVKQEERIEQEDVCNDLMIWEAGNRMRDRDFSEYKPI